MIIAIITNFAIIFSFTVLIYWVFSTIKKSKSLSKIDARLLSVITGIAFGLLGIIITSLFMGVVNNVLVNTRFVIFIFSGIIGGPITLATTGTFTFLFRLGFGFASKISLILAIHSLACALIFSMIIKYKPITFKNIHYYFAFTITELTLLLLIVYPFTIEALGSILLFVCYSTALYLLLHYFLKRQLELDKNAHNSASLKKVDYLTQLPNNLALENKLQQYLNNNTPFEFIHIDIDLFKNFNQTHGYRNGDGLLSQLAHTIRLYAEKNGAFVARIGGDEFCYVIANSSPAVAVTEGYHLSKTIEQTTYTVNDQPVSVTVSASIVSYPDNGITLNEIYIASNYALKMITESKTNTIKHINQIKQAHPHY